MTRQAVQVAAAVGGPEAVVALRILVAASLRIGVDQK